MDSITDRLTASARLHLAALSENAPSRMHALAAMARVLADELGAQSFVVDLDGETIGDDDATEANDPAG